MAQADIDRIAAQLGITVMGEYRDMLTAWAAELKVLALKLGGVSYGFFDDTIYLTVEADHPCPRLTVDFSQNLTPWLSIIQPNAASRMDESAA